MQHKIGAQTIPWGESVGARMEEIAAYLVRTGYDGVETGMRHFDASDTVRYKTLYRDTGLVPLGLHSGGQFWIPDAADDERKKLDAAVDFAAEVGFSYVVVSGNKDETVDSMRRAAETYNRLGERCRERGLAFAYHNHDWELANDAEILETLRTETEAETVLLVLDIAWAHVGGIDVSELLRRFGGRIAYLHIKDVRDKRFCELGTGEVDVPAVLAAAARERIEWLVVEQDYTDLTPEESIRLNYDYLRSVG